jgi:8-oxo-dGTP pyrophosphatase MutT (NUDIX family)
MKKPKFNNTPNEFVPAGTKAKKNYWMSRSASISGFIFARCDEINGGMLNVLITKRSKTMTDYPNLYCAPCGYFDWDENGYETMIRELYEETSLYLPDYQKFNIFDNHQQPFYTETSAGNNRQNIELMYITVLEFGEDKESFPMFVKNYANKETAAAIWMDWYTFTHANNGLEWAFNHDKRIQDALLYYNTGQYNINFFNEKMREWEKQKR